MSKETKGTIIVAVLNWGLGHATRSEPLIQRLQASGYRPVIASDGAALQYLRQRFPDLPAEELPPYGIRYGRRQLLTKLMFQMPRLSWVSRREHRRMAGLAESYQAVGVISDNRLGCWHPGLPSVYLSHQLKLMLPFGRRASSRMHHFFINRFDRCWVPDWPGEGNLSGELSHELKPGIPVDFIGPLSRFNGLELPPHSKRYDYCLLLSGPEPQRSLLEEKLIAQLPPLSAKVILLRGTRNPLQASLPEGWESMDLANTAEVAAAVRSSGMTISRSGYSSIMDYVWLGNKALLIPTPGQPEQLYLARYLTHKGYFLYAEQDYLDLPKQLEEAKKYRGLEDFPKPDQTGLDCLGFFEGKAEG